MNDKMIKTYRGKMQFKQAQEEEGLFTAVFATLNVVDHDGDVTLPGAFGEQDVYIEPWNHDYTLPVGDGIISEEDNKAVVNGEFWLEIQGAKDHYIVAKKRAEKQEWSYTFRIIESKSGEFEGRKVRFLEKLEVIGVSQVSKGAGINTHTTAIKALKDLLGDGEKDDGPAHDDADTAPAQPDAARLDSERPDETESEAGDPGNESGADPEDAQTYFEILARR